MSHEPTVKEAVSHSPCAYCRRPFNPTHSVPAAIHCLSRLLRERSVRILFQRVPGSVQLLAPLLRSNASSTAPNQQLLYEAGMCVWQLTFYEPAAEAMGSSGVVQGLVDMARSATKEKVTTYVDHDCQALCTQSPTRIWSYSTARCHRALQVVTVNLGYQSSAFHQCHCFCMLACRYKAILLQLKALFLDQAWQ